ncbi:lipopolysaccharide biosynthesis protein [Streptomyces sp. NBC_00233]|uniref:lipopolysaccharide biosynthesis protein n=1 Tax=Streptomyces sp. NBC_00233 TaxID=2975686 RepID=UPI002259265A|nr:lipopolysaccharide biosynthesis protein [Streptomyces sp. NBC_00233]MCX5231883.1 lipopolysaccharide biosynthesis protein [Streptomyces sp. NBC_00233]
MTSVARVAERSPVHQDEVTAVHGARWIATAVVVVGAVNYAYTLILTRLLDVSGYATFAAGQGLVVCTAAVAVVTVPWMLAQALARAGSDAERGEAVRFAMITAVVGGTVAAIAVGCVAMEFAGTLTTLAIAGSTLAIYVTRVSVGWLQGTERLRTLAVLTAAEALLKFGVGLFFVSALGLGETGALAAFGVAVLPYVFFWPRRFRNEPRRPWRAVSADRDLWRRASGVASLQGVVALLASVDIVLVAMLPTDRAAAASYQAAVMLGRVPLFLAGAVSIAFLPALSRRRAGDPLTASALRMYLTVALPLTVVAATVPNALITTVFPSGYSMVSTLMACTATAGLALGALALLVTFAQAVNDYACLRTLLVGLGLYVTALASGWATGGVLGMAIGGLCGTVAALVLLAVRHSRRHGFGVAERPFGRVVLPLLALAGGLALLRPFTYVWFAAAVVVTTVALWRFFGRRRTPVLGTGPAEGPEDGPGDGPGDGPVAGPEEAPPNGGTGAAPEAEPVPERREPPPAEARGTRVAVHDEHAVNLLVDAVWRGRVRPAADEELLGALAAARRNQVEGRLARAYPRQLAATLTEVESATGLFRRNLVESTDRLRAAGIPTVLIKADLAGDYVYGNFDLVVPPGRLRAAQAALDGWYAHRTTYWLERSTKVLLEPPKGPAAHLHGSVSWFGVPVVPSDRLFARAEHVARPGSANGHVNGSPDGHPRDAGDSDTAHDGTGGYAWLTPCPSDRLRIWLAHALFQNLTLDLSELLALRSLLHPDVVAEARHEAAREGWSAGGREALDTAVEAMARLDRGEHVPLPLPLPVATSLRVGAEHSGHLLGEGRLRAATREASLRVPLVMTKKLRRRVP